MLRDIEMAVVTINLKSDTPTWPTHLEQMAAAGLTLDETNENLRSVDGTIALDKVHGLEQLPFVTYVRKHYTYSAEHAEGHPLDRNQGIGSTPDSIFPAFARRRVGKMYP